MSEAASNAVSALNERLRKFIGAQVPPAQNIEVGNLAPLTAGNTRNAWSFDASWTERGTLRSLGCVMLRKAEAGQLETPLVPEFEVIRALGTTGVPIPRAYWIDPDGKWLERPAFIL